MSRLKEAFIEELAKVGTAFTSWGLGIFIMVAYSSFVYWLNQINTYLMAVGAVVFLGISYFFIDLWWRYSRGRGI